MSSLSIFAGPAARSHILQHGLRQEDIRLIIGASGGPKWFVLYGLDRYLFGEFFAGRQTPLATIGSSAGAWRLACLGQNDPVAAIDRLAEHYSGQTYSAKPDRHEVSREARSMLDRVLGDSGAREIAENPLIHTHIVADRMKGLLRSERSSLLGTGLVLCGLANAVSRRSLGLFLERVIFHTSRGGRILEPEDLPTRYVTLREENVRSALMATGSIPLVMESVTDIEATPGQVYRDGGISDYHFDLRFDQVDGLALYPHFYSAIVPGWFDKMARWRKIDPRHFDNVVLLAPSPEFVATLPGGKIPDRKDFETMTEAQRINNWQNVLAASEALGEEFSELLANGGLVDRIQPLTRDRSLHR